MARDTAPADDAVARARTIARRLARAYGSGHAARPTPEQRDPLDELILTLLSQHTSDINRDRAFEALRARYPSWDEVLGARVTSVRAAINPGGLAATKAPRIQAILREVLDREGRLSLARLHDMRDDEVVAYLTSLPGIGVKTAACVLAFSLGRPALPVDTHVQRIAVRLGFARMNDRVERVQHIWESMIPPSKRKDLHLDLIAHGRSVCRAQRPACGSCVVADLCPSAGTP